MSLLHDVVAVLEAGGIPHALIGAAAMAVHGVSRATADVDLLTVDTKVLRPDLWRGLESRGARLQLLKGDADDPLADNVRLVREGERTVDVVVGRHAWQREIIESARRVSIGKIALAVARPAGLILLKVHAGGPRDAWDIHALLECVDQVDAVKAEVDRLASGLPAECVALWKRLRDEA